MTTLYVTGTVSVTAGSRVVTGVGTGWQTALIVGGLFGVDAAGLSPIPIRSIDSDTSLTLEKPWRGASAQAQDYWIIRDTSAGRQAGANANALAQIINELRSAPLAALAGLAPAADTLAYFNGAGSASLTTLTQLARTLLSRTTGAAVYGDLGIIPNGQLPPRIRSTPAIVADCNTINENGWSVCDDTAANRPPIAGYWLIETILWPDLTQAKQKATSVFGTNVEFSRSKVDGVWRPWRSYSAGVLGTVSQSSGVPSGAIIERGANSNGQYVRFADGTQFCKTILDFSNVGVLAQFGSMFRSSNLTWFYPAAFVDVPTLPTSVSLNEDNVIAAGTRNIELSAANVFLWSSQSFSAGSKGDLRVQVFAKGKWF